MAIEFLSEYINYYQGDLYIEDVRLQDVVDKYGTPLYCYSSNHFRDQFNRMKSLAPEGTLIAFALKANSNISIVKILAELGAGADVVSEGEIRVALAAGIAANKIVFSGVGKTAQEIKFALEKGIYQFNVESVPELDLINKIATAMGKIAPVVIRINPDVKPDTHAKITTGGKENKFGIGLETVKGLSHNDYTALNILGLSVHIGSQLNKLEDFSVAFANVKEILHVLAEAGYNISRLDLGGGIGIKYKVQDPAFPIAEYFDLVKELFSEYELIFEPGRYIAGNAGILLTSITYLKNEAGRLFYIIDAGMNDLMRPAIYDAYHEISPIKQAKPGSTKGLFDIVGPICESSDVFAKKKEFPYLSEGTCLAIFSVGAYGRSMSNNYNSKPFPMEILIEENKYRIVADRQTYDSILRSNGANYIED